MIEFLTANAEFLIPAWSWIIANIEWMTSLVLAINVFMCACNTKWNWPVGLVGVTMYGLSAWFLWQLYADAVLQIFYFATGVYGWYHWCYGGVGRTEKPITVLTWKGWLLTIVTIALATLSVYTILKNFTDSPLPWSDSFTTAACLIAQCLLMWRIRSAWIIWIAADIAYLYLFDQRGLDVLFWTYSAFTLNAVWGWINWNRKMPCDGAGKISVFKKDGRLMITYNLKKPTDIKAVLRLEPVAVNPV